MCLCAGLCALVYHLNSLSTNSIPVCITQCALYSTAHTPVLICFLSVNGLADMTEEIEKEEKSKESGEKESTDKVSELVKVVVAQWWA